MLTALECAGDRVLQLQVHQPLELCRDSKTGSAWTLVLSAAMLLLMLLM
jgi:hypothetical protein